MQEGESHEESKDRLREFWSEYRLPLILGLASLLLVTVSLTFLLKSFQPTVPIEFTSDASPAAEINQTITVDIEGAVVKPGVYQLARGSRVEEAIVAAGGLSSEADSERIAQSINRAARLSDGAKLFIPRKGSGEGSGLRNSQGQIPFNGLTPISGVSVNLASQAELEALSGIGPVTAKKIIDGRPYGSLEELVTKKAMNQSLFSKLKDQLTL